MVSARQRAAARRNIKKAQAARRMKRSPSRARRSRPRRAPLRMRARRYAARSYKKHSGVFGEVGKWWKRIRTVDEVATGAQFAFYNHTQGGDIAQDLKRAYLGIGDDGQFNVNNALPNYEGIVTGLIRDKIRSKLGFYRGASHGKILSFVALASPEIVALETANPMDDFWTWEAMRVQADRGYGIYNNSYVLGNDNLKKSVTLDLVSFVAQKAAEATGVNKELSKATGGWLKL